MKQQHSGMIGKTTKNDLCCGRDQKEFTLVPGVPNSVLYLPNEVTLGEVSNANTSVSDWDCIVGGRGRQLLNRCTG